MLANVFQLSRKKNNQTTKENAFFDQNNKTLAINIINTLAINNIKILFFVIIVNPLFYFVLQLIISFYVLFFFIYFGVFFE